MGRNEVNSNPIQLMKTNLESTPATARSPRRIAAILAAGILASYAFMAASPARAIELTVERIDDYTYNSLFRQWEPVSTMGVMRHPGTFVAFSNQNVGRWMPNGASAPTQYPKGTYWTFASHVDLNVLRTTFTWLDFWWPTWQSTSGSGIVRVTPKRSTGGSGTLPQAANAGFGRESSGWRFVNGGRSVEMTVPSIRNISGLTSGSLRVGVAAMTSADLYHGRAGTIFASIDLSPLPKGYHYPSRTRVASTGRLPKGRMRTAMHLMEYRNGGFTVNESRTYSNTVTF